MVYKDKNKEKEYNKRYYQEHKKERKEYQKKWREENSNFNDKYSQKWYKKNKDNPEFKAKRKEYDKKWREEHKEEKKQYMKGYVRRDYAKEKNRERRKKYDKEHKRLCKDCGKKIWGRSLRCRSCMNKGELSPHWQGGKSFEPYNQNWTPKFRRAIRKRDNQVCMLCGIYREKLNRALSVHHINGDKQMSIPQNGISLCQHCHNGIVHNKETKTKKEHWTKFFQSLLYEMYGYKYSETNEIILNLKELENKT